MSWTCSYLINEVCLLLKKKCQPLQKGCVLEGKVTFINHAADSESESNQKKRKEK